MAEIVTYKPRLVPRYQWSLDECEEDEICIDRLTGEIVVRYDLGDPANYAPSHGGWPKSEWLSRAGRDAEEEVDIERCRVRVDPAEVERLKQIKVQKAERDQEEARSVDLLDFLGADADSFNFDFYSEHEHELLTPALERRGYKDIRFYMIEQDRFGPLIRGCVTTCHCGQRVRFFYG